jgi:quercetin dioxygenase-like cupin family protein
MSLEPRVLVRSGESAGAVGVVENVVPPRWEGPPLHHHDFDEGFYVLEGELTFQLGEELRSATRGQFAFVPAGGVHTLANLGEAPARYLLVTTPGGEPYPDTIVVGPRIGEQPGLGPARPLASQTGRVNVLLKSSESGGRVAVMDNVVPAEAQGPPLHHHDFDEAFYVLEGELTFQLGEELIPHRAGELAFARRGAHHTFANLSGAGARMLIICTPAGFERYFQQMAARQAGMEPPAEALEPWPEVVKVGPRIGEEPGPT